MLICLAFAGVLGLVATVLAFRLRRVNAPWVLALAFILSWVALLPGVIALAGVVGAVPRLTT